MYAGSDIDLFLKKEEEKEYLDFEEESYGSATIDNLYAYVLIFSA